jgi:23S rRNA C2498 (ribose-2'-O)-methylase RlmM
VHPTIIVTPQAARQGPSGLDSAASWSYQRPRLKKPRSASTRMTIKMIQRMLTFSPSPRCQR